DRPFSLLALRAVVAAAAGDHDAFDGRFADETGLAFAAIDAVLELEEAFFAVGINIVRDRRAAQGNCLAKNFFYGSEQLGQLVASDGRGTAAGANSGAEQGFISVDVSYSAQEFLIQQSTLDGGFAAAK